MEAAYPSETCDYYTALDPRLFTQQFYEVPNIEGCQLLMKC
jgi:hypothetical protein